MPIAFGARADFGLQPVREVGFVPKVTQWRSYPAGPSSESQFKLAHYRNSRIVDIPRLSIYSRRSQSNTWSAMPTGFVYALENSYLPDLIKIGKTTRSIEERMTELSTTGVSGSFNVLFLAPVSDVDSAEA